MFYLHTAIRHLAKALATPSSPDINRLCHGTSSSLIPWAATCPRVGISFLQCLSLLLTDVHSGNQLPWQTFSRGLHLLSSWFALATLLSPNHMVYRGVWGLKVLLPVFIIIQQGLGYTPCGAARLAIGRYAHGQGELGCGV